MTAAIVTLASSVSQLNAASFRKSSLRGTIAGFELSEMNAFEGSRRSTRGSRKSLDRMRQTHEYEIDVAVAKRIDMEIQTIDDLTAIGGGYRSGSKQSSHRVLEPAAPGRSAAITPDHLAELKQFTSVLTLVYRVWS